MPGEHSNVADVFYSAISKDKPQNDDPRPEITRHNSEGSSFPPRPQINLRVSSTPSARTGFPRSVDYISPATSRQATYESIPENGNASPGLGKRAIRGSEEDPYRTDFHRTDSDFRGALEYDNPEQREKEREAMERKERAKRRDTSWLDSDAWNPMKWLTADSGSPSTDDDRNLAHIRSDSPAPVTQNMSLSRSQSHPAPRSPTNAAPRWARLRSFLPQVAGNAHVEHMLPASSVAGKTVNITDELIAGGLSALLLRMWFERDERGARRIPVLLHRLRIRVSDSLHPLHGTKAVFRIEVCHLTVVVGGTAHLHFLSSVRVCQRCG